MTHFISVSWRGMCAVLVAFFILLDVQAAAASESPVSTAPGMAVQALAVKSDKVVVLYDVTGQEIARIHAVFGQGKGAKEREGDLKTPEGDYMLDPGRVSTEWEWFMPIDYPNANDIARAKAAGQSLSTLGGHIGMHSVGDGFMRNIRQSFSENWTLGCIAISEHDMAKVRQLVQTPIPIKIQP